MSDVVMLEERLAELTSARDALLAARTSESTAESARLFLESARRRSERIGGHVVGVHAVGSALDDVVRSFVLSDPRFEGWLIEQAGEFASLTEKAKAAQLKKVDGEIAVVEKDLLAAHKDAAISALEAEFAGEAA